MHMMQFREVCVNQTSLPVGIEATNFLRCDLKLFELLKSDNTTVLFTLNDVSKVKNDYIDAKLNKIRSDN